MDKKSSVKGFTLLELIIVIAVLGLLMGVAIIKFADLSNSARLATEQGFSAYVRTALLEYYSVNSNYPTVAGLNNYIVSMGSSSTSAIAGGIQVSINGTLFTVPTYTDDICTVQTNSTNSLVHCVGG